MEPVLARGDNYNFMKKLAENVKQTKDAKAPDNEVLNKVCKNLFLLSNAMTFLEIIDYVSPLSRDDLWKCARTLRFYVPRIRAVEDDPT